MTFKEIDRDTLRIGEYYMGRRYINAKRIIWEAFQFTGFFDLNGDQQIGGIWLSDGLPLKYVYSIAEFEIRWVDRKIKELEKQRAEIDRGLDLLRKIH
jgi:hypothetical protein